jgi:hypothetical protein
MDSGRWRNLFGIIIVTIIMMNLLRFAAELQKSLKSHHTDGGQKPTPQFSMERAFRVSELDETVNGLKTELNKTDLKSQHAENQSV